MLGPARTRGSTTPSSRDRAQSTPYVRPYFPSGGSGTRPPPTTANVTANSRQQSSEVVGGTLEMQQKILDEVRRGRDEIRKVVQQVSKLEEDQKKLTELIKRMSESSFTIETSVYKV